MAVSQCPLIDVKISSDPNWNYGSRNGAILALFLHCITNVHLRHAEHWSIEYHCYTRELLVLLPATKGLDTGAIVGALYRNTDDKVCLRQISKWCEIHPPIIIAKDYNGVFKQQTSEKRAKGN